ncbi:flagellar biosynthetic protein FliO [Ornithinibacillus salinisoli]|uniref:Flagellar biosynthetic protein FliO n=1 Tax=Ornithinibacillus salinisoli TaxID=1848459 RepID=A0ABW4VY64_9BACI
MIKKISISVTFILLLFISCFTVHAIAEEKNDQEERDDGTAKSMFENEDEDSEESGDETPPTNPDNNLSTTENGNSGSMVFDLVKMVFALLLVLALIYLLLKFLNKRNKLFSKVKALENVGGLTLGPNKSIQIIRVGSKLYMVGVGDNVELLHEITDEDMKKEILTSYEKQHNFSASGVWSTFMQPKSEVTESTNTRKKNDFKNMFATELDKLKKNRQKLRNMNQQKDDNHE